MSEDILSPHMRRPRSWLIAWLGGALAPLIAGAIPISMWAAEDLSGFNTGMPFFGVLHWTDLVLGITILGAIVAFPTALILTVLAAVIEREHPRTLLAWLALGLGATSPAALFFWGAAPHASQGWSFAAAPTLVLYALGLLGAATAWWLRHGGRR